MADLPKLPPLPAPTVPLVNPDRTPQRDWYLYLHALDRLLREQGKVIGGL